MEIVCSLFMMVPVAAVHGQVEVPLQPARAATAGCGGGVWVWVGIWMDLEVGVTTALAALRFGYGE